MLASFFLCLLIADFITGLIHWLEDTYGLPTWPVLGQEVIQPNIDHHRNPTLMLSMGGFLFRNYQSFLLAGVVTIGVYLAGYFTYSFLLIAVLASFGNEVHGWNHRIGRNHWAVELLHDLGLIQSKRQHSLHHKPPYDRCFCTLTNFVNPILDLILFWRGLEWLISLCGISPKRCTPAREGY